MVQYHFKTTDGPALGPIEADEFRQRVTDGEVVGDTLVWRSGMVDWLTFAQLRAMDEKASAPRVAEPPPLPALAVAVPEEPTPSRPTFRNCGFCGQQWPENLLTQIGLKHVCGICQRTKQEELKKSKFQTHASGISSGWGSWFLKTVGLAVVLGGLLFGKAWMKSRVRQGSKILHQQVQAASPRMSR